jgi:uncharacterized protein (TIGR00369 family)
MPRYLNKLLEEMPYCQHLGLEFNFENEELRARLPFKTDLVGNPLTQLIHGGVIGACLELTAVAQLTMTRKLERLPKTINVTIDFLRPGRPKDVHFKALVYKDGRRVANLEAFAWQDNEAQPISKLHGNFLMG